jgi:hypothetical protein
MLPLWTKDYSPTWAFCRMPINTRLSKALKMPTRYDLKNKIACSAGRRIQRSKENNGLISSPYVPSPNVLRTSGGPNANGVVVNLVAVL